MCCGEGGFPHFWLWWVTKAVALVVTAVTSEAICLKYEMADINTADLTARSGNRATSSKGASVSGLPPRPPGHTGNSTEPTGGDMGMSGVGGGSSTAGGVGSAFTAALRTPGRVLKAAWSSKKADRRSSPGSSSNAGEIQALLSPGADIEMALRPSGG